jgi:hypothetical protein
MSVAETSSDRTARGETARSITGIEAGVDVGASALSGRNRISSRAIERVVAAVTAGEMGVEPRHVGVQLGDDSGSVVVTASAAVTLVSLNARGRKAAAAAEAGSIVERATAAQKVIRERVRDITGSAIGHVNLRLNAAHIDGEERVQ